MDAVSELEQLKEDLEKIRHAIFMMSMSDNFCYSTGRICPLKNKEKDLMKQIAETDYRLRERG